MASINTLRKELEAYERMRNELLRKYPRILATMIADPRKLDDKVLEEWLTGVDNWDLADQLVLNLLWRMNNALEKAVDGVGDPKNTLRE